MLRTCLLVLIGTVVGGTVALADMKVVKLKDGREITGEVTETPDGYQVKLVGGMITFSADQVLSVTDFVTPQTEYEKRLGKIDPNSAQDRYELGKWAFENDLLEPARTELQKALELRKDYERAALLLRQVDAAIAEADARRRPPEPGPDATTGPGAVGPGIKNEWLLSEEDIYRIRLEELRVGDPVAVDFRNKLLDRFIERMRGRGMFETDPAAKQRFLGMPPAAKTSYILENTDRDDAATKDDILVKTDPRALRTFRSSIWPIVVRGCGTAHCHGGDKIRGGFKVFGVQIRGEQVDYTNFVLTDGAVASRRRVIDRENPSMSLLLQYGLPSTSDLARLRHPESVKVPFVYRDQTDPKYRLVLAWIESLKRPHPDYRLAYKPPFGLKLVFKLKVELPPPSTEPAPTGEFKPAVGPAEPG